MSWHLWHSTVMCPGNDVPRPSGLEVAIDDAPGARMPAALRAPRDTSCPTVAWHRMHWPCLACSVWSNFEPGFDATTGWHRTHRLLGISTAWPGKTGDVVKWSQTSLSATNLCAPCATIPGSMWQSTQLVDVWPPPAHAW